MNSEDIILNETTQSWNTVWFHLTLGTEGSQNHRDRMAVVKTGGLEWGDSV